MYDYRKANGSNHMYDYRKANKNGQNSDKKKLRRSQNKKRKATKKGNISDINLSNNTVQLGPQQLINFKNDNYSEEEDADETDHELLTMSFTSSSISSCDSDAEIVSVSTLEQHLPSTSSSASSPFDLCNVLQNEIESRNRAEPMQRFLKLVQSQPRCWADWSTDSDCPGSDNDCEEVNESQWL